MSYVPNCEKNGTNCERNGELLREKRDKLREKRRVKTRKTEHSADRMRLLLFNLGKKPCICSKSERNGVNLLGFNLTTARKTE